MFYIEKWTPQLPLSLWNYCCKHPVHPSQTSTNIPKAFNSQTVVELMFPSNFDNERTMRRASINQITVFSPLYTESLLHRDPVSQ